MMDIDLSGFDGLVARDFARGDDHAAIARLLNRRFEEQGIEEIVTTEGVEINYRNLSNCDTDLDMVMIDHDGVLVGYTRTDWWQVIGAERKYAVFARTDPSYFDTGLQATMLVACEARAGQVAQAHEIDSPKAFETWTAGTDIESRVHVESVGYAPLTHGADMVRPDLEAIPEESLPTGVEIRAVEDGHLPAIFEASEDAFLDHWGAAEPEPEDYQRFLEFEHNDQTLWQVAWSGDHVVGQVRSFIAEAENEHYRRRRGYTGFISTDRAWRKQGIATALICESMRELRDRGMTEAALGVHTENPTGAFDFFQALGFQETFRWTTYGKAILSTEY